MISVVSGRPGAGLISPAGSPSAGRLPSGQPGTGVFMSSGLTDAGIVILSGQTGAGDLYLFFCAFGLIDVLCGKGSNETRSDVQV